MFGSAERDSSQDFRAVRAPDKPKRAKTLGMSSARLSCRRLPQIGSARLLQNIHVQVVVVLQQTSRGSPRARPGQASGRFGTPQGKLDLVADACRDPRARAVRATLACHVLHPISLLGRDEADHYFCISAVLFCSRHRPSRGSVASAVGADSRVDQDRMRSDLARTSGFPTPNSGLCRPRRPHAGLKRTSGHWAQAVLARPRSHRNRPMLYAMFTIVTAALARARPTVRIVSPIRAFW